VAGKNSNPVSIWLSNFRTEIAEASKTWTPEDEDEDDEEKDEISQAIDDYISKIDPLMKGTLTDEDVEKLDSEAKEMLSEIQDSIKNSKGEVDFFCFLKKFVSEGEEEEMEEHLVNFIAQSDAFNSLPTDYYEALAKLELTPSDIIEKLVGSVAEESPFRKYLTWAQESSVPKKPGIVERDAAGEDFPTEFKNSSGDFDLYVTINYLKSHPEDKRWEDVLPSLKGLEVAVSCEELYSKFTSTQTSPDYNASLLWVLN
jgi:hypothetical protein